MSETKTETTAEKTVFLTGVTSFTGGHIGRAFKGQGYRVLASLSQTRDRSEADSLAKERLDFADPDVIIENCVFGSPAMLAAIKKLKPHIFVNHGAAIRGYRDPGFDYLASVNSALHNAREVFETLRENGCKRLIHSGSIFESDEGTSNVGMVPSSEAQSIYGASKGMVWSALRYWSHTTALPISKIVIPNPIGPMENADRMVPLFWKLWGKGDAPVLRTPRLIRDNIPAPWLANVYVHEASLAEDGPWQDDLAPIRIRRPSGFVLPNEAFVTELSAQFRKHGCKWECGHRVEEVESKEALERFNSEHVPEVSQPEAIEKFWSDWSSYLMRDPRRP